MIIYLGMDVRGEIYPSLVDDGKAKLGVSTLNITGFVELLELKLGLRKIRRPAHIQKEIYLQALEACKDGAFYEKSLEVDPLGVAQDIYTKRCELLISGYEFKDKGAPARLGDLIRVEEKFECKDSLEDRIANLWHFLGEKGFQGPKIAEINLLAQIDSFPLLFRKILKGLEKAGTLIKEVKAGTQSSSVKIVKVKNEFDAIEATNQVLKSEKNSIAYIKSHQDLLNLYQVYDGMPSIGRGAHSYSRPSIQFVILMSQFIWEPLDPNKVVALLNLSLKPFSSGLSWRLARALAEAPGFWGEPWMKAIKKYEEEEEDENVRKKAIQAMEFLFRRERFNEEAAPVDKVLEIFNFTKEYFSKRIALSGERETFRVGFSIASELCELLKVVKNRKQTLSKLELDRLLESSIPQIAEVMLPEQVGMSNVISSAECLVDKVDKLVWAPFVDMTASVKGQFWTPDELKYFESNSVELVPAYKKVEFDLERERRLLGMANEIILVVPENLDGDQCGEHPLINEIKYEELEVCKLIEGNAEESRVTKLPTIKAKWNLKNTRVLKPREYESYSSLEKAFYFPWLYVLDYKAKLSAESVTSISNDFRVKGIFTHKIFEGFFTEFKNPEAMKNIDVNSWVCERFDDYVEKYAVLWKQNGQETILASIKDETIKGLSTLRDHLVEDNWSVLGMEQKLEGSFFKTGFTGYIDMALIRGEEKCIVDLKYGGSKKYQALLKENKDIQLALYSKFFGEGRFTHTAYYIIADASLYAKDQTAFSKARSYASKDFVSDYGDIWAKMDNTYGERMAELGKGEVVVRDFVTKGMVQEENVNGEDFLDVASEVGTKYHDYSVLTGYVFGEDDE